MSLFARNRASIPAVSVWDQIPAQYKQSENPDSGEVTKFPWAIVPGGALGLDNNFKYAVTPQNEIERLYQYNEGGSNFFGGNLQNTLAVRESAVATKASGTDEHGNPIYPGYSIVADSKPRSNFFWDTFGPQAAFTALTFGIGSVASAGTVASAETATEVSVANDSVFLGDLPIDPALDTPLINDNFVGDLPVDPSAGTGANNVGVPDGLTRLGATLGGKLLDYSLARNLQNTRNAASNSVRSQNQSEVSRAAGTPWNHPASSNSFGNIRGVDSSVWILAAIGFFLLILLSFMRR